MAFSFTSLTKAVLLLLVGLSFHNTVIQPGIASCYLLNMGALSLATVYWLRNKAGLLPLDGISVPVFIGLVLTIVCTIASDTVASFPTNRWMVAATTYGGMYMVCFYLIRNQPAAFRFVSFLFFAFSILASLQYVYIEFIQKGPYDGEGFLISKGLLSIYLLTAMFMVLHTVSYHRIYSLAVIGFTVLMLVLLGSRTAILAGLVSASVVFLLHHRKYVAFKYILPAIAFILAIACLLYLYRPDSVKGRFLLWETGLSAMHLKNWVFGNGLGFIEYKLPELQRVFLQTRPMPDRLLAGNVNTILNEYLRLFIELGIAGVILVGLVTYRVLRTFILQRHYFLAGAIVGLMVFSFSSYPFYAAQIDLQAVALVAYAATIYQGKDTLHLGHLFSPNVARWGKVLIAISGLVYFVGVDFTYLRALYRWEDHRHTLQVQYNEPAFRKVYNELSSQLKNEPGFLHDYALKLQSLSYYEEATTLLVKVVQVQPSCQRYMLLGHNHEMLGHHEQAEEYYKKAIHTLPKSFLPKYLLFDLYRQAGEQDKAIDVGLAIARHPVKVTSSDVTRIKREVTDFLNHNYITYEED